MSEEGDLDMDTNGDAASGARTAPVAPPAVAPELAALTPAAAAASTGVEAAPHTIPRLVISLSPAARGADPCRRTNSELTVM